MIWIVLSISSLALLLFALMDTAKREDRVARHSEKHREPLSDVYVTVTGTGATQSRGLRERSSGRRQQI